jgi:hypothetical protein
LFIQNKQDEKLAEQTFGRTERKVNTNVSLSLEIYKTAMSMLLVAGI